MVSCSIKLLSLHFRKTYIDKGYLTLTARYSLSIFIDYRKQKKGDQTTSHQGKQTPSPGNFKNLLGPGTSNFNLKRSLFTTKGETGQVRLC